MREEFVIKRTVQKFIAIIMTMEMMNMTEKRFTINQGYNDRYIFDNVLNEIIAFSQVCNRLNEQVQKIYNLEKENEQLKQQLADIDRLIYDLGHDEMRRQYEEIFKGDDVE